MSRAPPTANGRAPRGRRAARPFTAGERAQPEIAPCDPPAFSAARRASTSVLLAEVVELVELRVEAGCRELLGCRAPWPPRGGSCPRSGRSRWWGRGCRCDFTASCTCFCAAAVFARATSSSRLVCSSTSLLAACRRGRPSACRRPRSARRCAARPTCASFSARDLAAERDLGEVVELVGIGGVAGGAQLVGLAAGGQRLVAPVGGGLDVFAVVVLEQAQVADGLRRSRPRRRRCCW